MVNIDKEKINNNINDAYENQTEKVKELLEAAKKNLADYKPCPYDYTTKKENAKQLYKVNRVVTKNKEEKNKAEDRIKTQFNEMNEKLNINSKNIDFIFETVSKTNKDEINLLKDISKKQEEHNENINKIVEKFNTNVNQNTEVQVNETIKKDISEAIQNVKIEQNKVQETLLNATSNVEFNIINKGSQIEKNIINSKNMIEAKMIEMQKINDEKINQVKEDIIKAYQRENKHAISSLLEERNAYLRELQEKDREIRQLNYKIYEYEEKLEREIARREKFSLFAPFFRREEVKEEEPVYITQILNSVY